MMSYFLKSINLYTGTRETKISQSNSRILYIIAMEQLLYLFEVHNGILKTIRKTKVFRHIQRYQSRKKHILEEKN